MTDGLRCEKGRWGDTEQDDLKELKGNQKETVEEKEEKKNKFRIHNVTVELSGEIHTGDPAQGNEICHHLGVRHP